MSKAYNDKLIVLPRLQYKLSTDKILSIPVNLDGDRKEFVDSNRSRDVNSYQQSVVERNESNVYRLGGKIKQLFYNTLSGVTNYDNYKNFMYLTNPVSVLTNNDILFDNSGRRVIDTFGIKWNGFPQYHEFSFLRNDVENPQFDYQPQSAASYNWSCYVSYVYSSSTTQRMSYVNTQLSGNPVNFVASDGIPFTIVNTVANGANYITFRCGGKHHLTPSQFVELSISYNGNNLFQVDSIGEAGYDNGETSFSIVNYGYTGNTFVNGVSGTFKRIADINNSGETKSKYYIRLHKLLTNEKGVTLNKMGFEQLPFAKKEKIEYSALTPNLQERISVLDGTQTYNFVVVNDLDVSQLTTNFNKPVTNLYLTIVNKGYTGWFNKPSPSTNTAIQYGWEFNFQRETIDNWWTQNNLDSFENIPVIEYSKNVGSDTYLFYYNSSLQTGHTLIGDFCEYNEAEQLEYIISNCNHKLTFNDSLYQIDSQSTSIPEGYFYIPHHEIPLKKYSNNLSTELSVEPLNRPNWAYYSQQDGLWKWRNILLPGELEEDPGGVSINGLDYPFLNGAHYPFSQILFNLTTPFKNINTTDPVVQDPIIDDCE
jgi:hypothetical protein